MTYKRYAESAACGGLISLRTKKDRQVLSDEQKAQESFLASVRRSKKAVRFGVKAIGADHLLTLTYRSPEGQEMSDFERLKADWKEFCRLVRKGLPACGDLPARAGLNEWRFVAIPEFQDNGAYHLHVAIVGRQDINFLRRCWYKALGASQDAKGADTPGQVDVKGPSKRWGSRTQNWKPSNLSSYMVKYLHKTFEHTVHAKGSKRYWAGRTNEKPEVVKYWLKAQEYVDAVIETHMLFRHEVMESEGKMWASSGYDAIWFSG
ncbi:rolling circle replication-associated protein [Georgfuchsia toluolica]|uniref:rolling circle replication-associated protein n=1 Tax=Georgfuchsia toluolica TaxID=424218 RepID=UPI001C7339EA|nr:hypothetical protein [Georgfuchsia toluolica]